MLSIETSYSVIPVMPDRDEVKHNADQESSAAEVDQCRGFPPRRLVSVAFHQELRLVGKGAFVNILGNSPGFVT